MQRFLAFLLILLVLGSLACAGPRTSANYSIVTDTADAGGARTTSAAYTNDGSAGEGSVSTVASPTEIARSGYAGQLYDITGLALNSGSVNASVSETATLQLAAFQQLDDASFLAVDANSVAWSVISGPITGISSVGLATAGTAYQNTAATVQGIFGSLTGQLQLTVLDTIPDNFGSYAGDGIDDTWQVQYFGRNNPQAGPNVDADGTGQTNLFKYIAGLNPTDPASRFTITIAPVPGQPGQKNVILSPIVAGRTYTVVARSSLSTAGGWSAINASAPSDNGTQRTITDLSASGAAKFYEVQISKP